MGRFDTKKSLIALITIAASIVFISTLYRAVFRAPTDEIPLPDETVALTNTETQKYPATLSIPKLNIVAEVREVGITSRGNMGTPDSYENVGWYKYGTIPGEAGSAVLAGHVDDGLSLPGVFANLDNLEIGDDVYVVNREGREILFKVSAINTYDFDEKVPEIFNVSEGSLIRLITCTGSWVKDEKTHDKRLVVTATLSTAQ